MITSIYNICFVLSGAIDNERYGEYLFDITSDTVMHGFAGYFDTVLYKDVMLSKFTLRMRNH